MNGDAECVQDSITSIKQSLVIESSRFCAALIKLMRSSIGGVVAQGTHLSVTSTQITPHIRVACLVYNSQFATISVLNEQPEFGHYITETLAEELITVPLPPFP